MSALSARSVGVSNSAIRTVLHTLEFLSFPVLKTANPLCVRRFRPELYNNLFATTYLLLIENKPFTIHHKFHIIIHFMVVQQIT